MLQQKNSIMQRVFKRGGSFLSNALERYNKEIHLLQYQFCGPNTRVLERLNKGQRGINKLDQACLRHDLSYLRNKDLKTRHLADADLIQEAKARIFAKDSSIGEKIAAGAVSGLIAAKKKMGMGRKNSKKRRNSRKKKGGFIMPILTGLGTAASLIGGASSIAKNIQTVQQNKKLINEVQRHNKAIENLVGGKGLFLRPYKKGQGYRKRKKHRK